MNNMVEMRIFDTVATQASPSLGT